MVTHTHTLYLIDVAVLGHVDDAIELFVVAVQQVHNS